MAVEKETYFKLIDRSQNTESNQWVRFNTLLVINSLAYSGLLSDGY